MVIWIWCSIMNITWTWCLLFCLILWRWIYRTSPDMSDCCSVRARITGYSYNLKCWNLPSNNRLKGIKTSVARGKIFQNSLVGQGVNHCAQMRLKSDHCGAELGRNCNKNSAQTCWNVKSALPRFHEAQLSFRSSIPADLYDGRPASIAAPTKEIHQCHCLQRCRPTPILLCLTVP